MTRSEFRVILSVIITCVVSIVVIGILMARQAPPPPDPKDTCALAGEVCRDIPEDQMCADTLERCTQLQAAEREHSAQRQVNGR